MLLHPAWKDLLINTTFWAVLLVGGVFARTVLESRAEPDLAGPTGEARRLLESRSLLVFLLVGTCLSSGFALYLGYAAPRDIMQDILGARFLWQGESPYIPDMGPLAKSSLEAEPALIRLGEWWPKMAERERLWDAEAVPAHTPFMMVTFMPFVRWLSIRGTFLAHMLLSAGGLLIALRLLSRDLGWRLSPLLTASLAVAVFGWHPVASSFRFGQSIGVLALLITLSWSCLRANRPTAAGVAVGVATCLRIYPGLLMPYFLLFHPRAFVAAAATCVVGFGAPMLWIGVDPYTDWLQIAHLMFEKYGDVAYNLSLIGVVLKSGGALGLTLSADAVLTGVMGVAALSTLFCVAPRRPVDEMGRKRRIDLDYGLLVALMILVSPTTWDHYLPILLLPAAVVGSHVFAAGRSAGGALVFVGLLLLLAVPSWTYLWLFSSSPLPALVRVPLASTPTLAALALAAWIGALHRAPLPRRIELGAAS
jgi:hypothetical protein